MFTNTVGVVNNISDVMKPSIRRISETNGIVHTKLSHIDAGVNVNELVHFVAMVAMVWTS